MNWYEREVEVDVHEVDFNGVCKASALMRYIQTAAQCQLTNIGMSYDQLKARGRAFVLARIKLEFTETLRAYDKLTAVTFPCESRAFSFLRCYKLLKDGRTVGRAVSLWALLDIENHSLVRASDFEMPLPLLEPLDLSLSFFRLPTEMQEVGKYQVSYGTVDQNKHMNNTTYPDMYANFLPLENKRIAEITINYNKEAPAGDVLTVYCGMKDGIYYFRTVRSDGAVNSEAEIRLTDI